MNTVMNKHIRMGTGALLLGIFLCAGMFGGCKDLFHPEGPEEKAGDRSPPSASSTPSAPSWVTVSAESSSSITVSWGSVSGASYYDVYRASSYNGSYSYIASTSNTSSYTDTGLSPNTTYYYKVSAWNSYGESSQSNYDYATTYGTSTGGTTLSPPSSVSASAQSSSSITVSWDSVSGASGYNVYRADSSYGSYSSIGSTSSTSYTDTGLSSNTAYYYKVSAYNSSVVSSLSSSYGSATTWTSTGGTQYTVTFNADGGSPVTQTKTVTGGASIGASNMPSEPTRSGYVFGGWYTSSGGWDTEFTAATTVTEAITVYARWKSLDDLSLDDALTWISANAANGGTYTITLKNNESIAPRTLSYNGKQVGITIKGGTSERTVSLSTTGSLFTVESGVTLTLDNNVTLRGRSDNTDSLVDVRGTLVMHTGSRITGNSYTSSSFISGGVYVDNNGTFTMSGGEISGNSSASGGGVYVSNNGGTFTMSDGEISGNSSYYNGGGVYVGGSGTFAMSAGEISGNSSNYGGGGAYVSGTFTMSGGVISGNKVPYYSSGGGVHVSGTFTMSGGVISDNSASSGGGVYVPGTFTKQSGGVIYGSNASSGLKNTSSVNNGHAVYVSSGKIRNTTAGVGVTLDSAVSGSTGGWE